VSAGPSKPKTARARALQAFVLALLFALMLGVTRVMPALDGGGATVAAIGFLLLAGTLMSELFEIVGLPHLSGYLAAGIVAGPYALRLLDHHTVDALTNVNALALALIALEGGAELRVSALREGFRGLAWAMFMQTVPIMLIVGAVFVLARPLMPFMSSLGFSAVLGAGLLWGVVAMTRSPSAALGILSQTRASGPVAKFTLNFVMASDIVVVVLMAAGIMLARPLVDPGGSFSISEFKTLGHELLGSVALGTSLGLVLALYLRFVGKQLVVVFLALGFGMSEVLKYLGVEALLTFMVAGFIVQNLSKQGDKLVHAIQRMGGVVYIVFFATAGAHLDVPLLQRLWPVALLFFVARAAVTIVAARIAGYAAKDPPILKRWAWAGLISQAGVALGVSNLIATQFPSFGAGFRAIAVACIALNEMIGPVMFKLALDRAGETSKAPRASLASLAQAAHG
jgi:Kef-type K+ transport system membrane component KefB